MLHFAKTYASIQYKKQHQHKKIDIPEDLTDLNNDLLDFAKQKDGSKQKVSAVSYLKQDKYKNIRRKYLHLSASPESGKKGLGARVKDWASRDEHGNPNRKVIDG
ncbi:hypothetical protein FACS189429_0040 [Bacteroidia bacterium]|nr:hypothetical protein FACS189429_0040 [Bacteroidia bacterium]